MKSSIVSLLFFLSSLSALDLYTAEQKLNAQQHAVATASSTLSTTVPHPPSTPRVGGLPGATASASSAAVPTTPIAAMANHVEVKTSSHLSTPSTHRLPNNAGMGTQLFGALVDFAHRGLQSSGSYFLWSAENGSLQAATPGDRLALTSHGIEYQMQQLDPLTGDDGKKLTHRLSQATNVITIAQSNGITLDPELVSPFVRTLEQHIQQLTALKALLAPAKKA